MNSKCVFTKGKQSSADAVLNGASRYSAVSRGNGCDGTRRNTVSEVLSQKDATRNGVLEAFAGIGVANPRL
jgi:hypothetical protein